MSTVAKGTAFQNEVFEVLGKELEGGRLGLDPNSARIFKQKGYYSKDREKEIIVDISIEVWTPGANNYALLWVCECKNYCAPIPVDDVEEFKSKLDQIAGKNVKGVVATRRSFQSGALSYARSQGIGLVRIMPPDQVTWLIHFMTTASLSPKKLDPSEFNAALTNEHHQAMERVFYAAFDGYIFGGWDALLRHSLASAS